MKKAKKLLSMLLAWVMVLALVGPSVYAAEVDETTNTVTLHKLVAKEGTTLAEIQAALNAQYDGTDQQKDGGAISDLYTELAEAKDGIYFALKFADGDNAGKYVLADTADKLKPAEPLAATEDIDKAVGGLTANGGQIVFKTAGLKGEFEIDEIVEKSEYINGDKTLTEKLAVPVKITLPLYNEEGVVTDAHVYPKNAEKAPQIDKNFKKADDPANELEPAEGFTPAAEGAGVGVGAKYENYQKNKDTAKAELGKVVPYEIKTEIPAKARYQTAVWTDQMTDGLTFDPNSVVVTIGGKEVTKGTEYTLTTGAEAKGNTFMIALEEAGLALINDKDAAVEIVITYTATVNNQAIQDIPESNDVMFHYGNNPSQGNTPIPTKPNDNAEVSITKNWDDGVWAEGEAATFELIDANTGQAVTADDLVNTDADDTAFNAYKGTFNAQVELKKGDTTASHTWKYLNKDKQYKVVEISSTTPSDVEYAKNADGELVATNHKSNNPNPLNPTEPKVVNGGKKFVKTNDKTGDDQLRLAGAEFYIKDADGKYLVAKTGTAQDAANVDVSTTKAELDAAVQAYNDLTAEQQADDAVAQPLKDKIDAAQKAYDAAFKEAAQEYEWVAANEDGSAPEGAVVRVSDAQGRFEIWGLDYGTYHLEEKTPPKGFAKLPGTISFEVKLNSYEGDEATELQYNEADANDGYGLQVINRKVTIPQTGGMGTILFVVVGVALMAGATIAMKKRSSVEG